MSEEKQTNKKINRDILKWVVIGLIGFTVVILIFSAGMVVGGMKAKFSYRWAESYHKNFAGPRGGFFGDWRSPSLFPGNFIEGYGTFGKIIKIEDNVFVIKGRGDIEKIVVTTEDTIIKKGVETLKDGLKVGDYVVIIGSPNKMGQIEAKLIRVFNGKLKNLSMPHKGLRFPLLK